MSLLKFFMPGMACFGFIACSEQSITTEDFTHYVDPYIGTGGHGHVFMGVNMPFGAVQVGPTNFYQEWDWCSGYHYSDTTIVGFSQTHLSGTGIGDMGDIALMPVTGEVPMNARGKRGDYSTNFHSFYSHTNEEARIGYYRVLLDRYNVQAELTATKRVALHRYTFPEHEHAGIVFDLKNGIGWDRPEVTSVTMLNDTTLVGCRNSSGWAVNQQVYYVASFSKPIEKLEIFNDGKAVEGTTATGNSLYARASFGTKEQEAVQVKIAISPVSIENAQLNMQSELPGWDFENTRQEVVAAWNHELGKVRVTDKNEANKRILYTSLYHSMIAPSVFNDVNGAYRGSDPERKVYQAEGFTNYTTFSLWDTYRAAHPLMTIIHPEKVNDIVNTMLAIYEQQGKLPIWHLAGNETHCMVGNPAIPVVADAYLKGFRGFDAEKAFEAMKNSALQNDRGLHFIKSMGYLPCDSIVESVAQGLEYALADWSVAQVAHKMNKEADYKLFAERGDAYKYYFDPAVNFMRGKDSNGNWRTPFDPFKAEHRVNDYTEGNAWQYTWLVPQDVNGLISLFGSEEAFTNKLDSLFVVEGDLGEHASADITGLIGQYAQGNEPSHHVIYMYPYAGQQWKTAKMAREILTTMFTDKQDGICGNEDVGQMSAWYVLSSMGFYQVAPAGGVYVFGSPLFDEMELNIGNGKTLQILATNNAPENMYIQSVKWNNKPYTRSYITHAELAAGGKLEFIMGAEPNKEFGAAPEDRPRSGIIQ